MKSLFILALCLTPLSAMAQGVWESPDAVAEQMKADSAHASVNRNVKDAKYLEGAVTEVDGRVEWRMDVSVPGKTAAQIYDAVFECLTDMTKAEGQLEGSRVALVNRQEHIIAATVREWLVFSDRLLSLDRAKLHYTLVAHCADGHLTVTMGRISYRYGGGGASRSEEVYKAEEMISDDAALNKKKTRLLPITAKFRRKTVDRKDVVFSLIRDAVTEGK